MNLTNPVPVTAGLRGAQWDPSRLPSDAHLTTHVLPTQDGATTSGFLFRRCGERAVVCLMHPREVLIAHYLVPDILMAGAAVWVQAPRSPGNDIRLEHEIALHDVAAGLRFLRSEGFTSIILLGNSGGAGLYAFYNEQACLAPDARFATTPAGRPTGLEKAELPLADGMIFVSPHPGQGRLLMNAIDPSVTDEGDPCSVDGSLDPFAPENGYAPYPVGARYDAAFVQKYRQAQRDRVARLDERARQLVAERQHARRRLKEGDASRGTRIAAASTSIMTIWRTDADLRCFDLSLDPSERRFGSLWGRDPFVSNWGAVGFARLCTPESWLSTWSGLSSRAAVERCGPAIEQPMLLIQYTGDNCVFPSDIDAIFGAIRSSDKQRVAVAGDHHGRPINQGEPSGQLIAGGLIRDWLIDKFQNSLRN